MSDMKKLIESIDRLSEAVPAHDDPIWDLSPAERIKAQQDRAVAGAKMPDSLAAMKERPKKYIGDAHHSSKTYDVEESSGDVGETDGIHIGAYVFANWDQFGHPMEVISIVDDQRVKVKDDFGNVEVMFIKDLEVAEPDYTPDEDVYPETSDHAVTESDESITEEIKAAFEDYVKNKSAAPDEKTRVTITYKDGHTQTKLVTDKERKRYETSDSVEKVVDAKGGKGRLDDTKLSESKYQMKIVDQLVAKGYSEDKAFNIVSYLVAGGETFKKGNPNYQLCKDACNLLNFNCESKLSESKYQDSIVAKLVAKGHDEGKAESIVSYLIAGGHTMKPGNPNYQLCKDACNLLNFNCESKLSEAAEVDMTGKKCPKCKKGTFQERSQHDDMQGTVSCSCGNSVKRYSKKVSKLNAGPGIDEAKGKSENRALWDKINSKGRMAPIDRERYTDLSHEGLEGPFRMKTGQVLYYDPKAGQYYNRDTDMYVSNEEMDEINRYGLAEDQVTELSDKTLSSYREKTLPKVIPTLMKGDKVKAAKLANSAGLAKSKLERMARLRASLEKLQGAVKEAKSKLGCNKLEETPIDELVANAAPTGTAATTTAQPAAGAPATTAKPAVGSTPASNAEASKPATTTTTPAPAVAAVQSNNPEAMKGFVDAIAKNPTVASNPQAAKALGAVLGVKPK